MPILNLKIGAKRSEALTDAAVGTLTEITSRILGKKPEVTAVTVSYVDPADWHIAGRSLAAHQQSSFYLDIKVTDETNTKAEKARYVAEVFSAMSGLLGALHPVSYVYVEDVRGTAYGYDGRTQEHRAHHP